MHLCCQDRIGIRSVSLRYDCHSHRFLARRKAVIRAAESISIRFIYLTAIQKHRAVTVGPNSSCCFRYYRSQLSSIGNSSHLGVALHCGRGTGQVSPGQMHRLFIVATIVIIGPRDPLSLDRSPRGVQGVRHRPIGVDTIRGQSASCA
eukprot:scaffold38025_cov25-Tisochrysis_lutea.AAC.3